jgi:hypothetical protein
MESAWPQRGLCIVYCSVLYRLLPSTLFASKAAKHAEMARVADAITAQDEWAWQARRLIVTYPTRPISQQGQVWCVRLEPGSRVQRDSTR